MTKGDVDSCLKGEVQDLIHDLLTLNDVSMECQFQGYDVIFYRHWLKQAIAYALLVEYHLTPTKKTLDLTEFTQECNSEDLKDLTNRVIINLARTIQIYKEETPYADILAAVMMSLTMCKKYATN